MNPSLKSRDLAQPSHFPNGDTESHRKSVTRQGHSRSWGRSHFRMGLCRLSAVSTLLLSPRRGPLKPPGIADQGRILFPRTRRGGHQLESPTMMRMTVSEVGEGLMPSRRYEHYLKPAPGGTRGDAGTGSLARMTSESPSQSFSHGNPINRAPAAAVASYPKRISGTHLGSKRPGPPELKN